MKSVPLTAYTRTQAKRTGSKKVRAASRVPAVIYGQKIQSQSLELNLRELQDTLHRSVGATMLVDLSVSNDARPKRLALLQEVQHHPLTGKILHVDFHEVAEVMLMTSRSFGKRRRSTITAPAAASSNISNGHFNKTATGK